MDCCAETAMAFGLGDLIGANSTLADQAAKVYDFVYFQSVAQQGPRANVSDPAYSLIAWGISSPSWITAFYGDDNARVLLASLAGSAALRASPGASEGASYDRWDEPILRAILANARTSSVNGFRPGRINLPDLEKNGWQYYFDAGFDYHNTSSPQPHYQSFLWATYLWAYQTTGIQMLYDKAEAGIRDSMDVYGTDGAKWAWTEYLSEVRARSYAGCCPSCSLTTVCDSDRSGRTCCCRSRGLCELTPVTNMWAGSTPWCSPTSGTAAPSHQVLSKSGSARQECAQPARRRATLHTAVGRRP